MNCERCEMLLGLAAGGDLDGEGLRALEDHLRQCPACRAFEESLEHSRGAFLALGEVTVPAGMEADLTKRVMEAVARESAAAPIPFTWRPLVPWAVAASLLLAVLGVVVARSGFRPQPATGPAARAEAPSRQSLRIPPVTPDHSGEQGASPLSQPSSRRLTIARAPRPIQDARPTQAAAHGEADEPLVIRLQTEDPDVLIYWVVPPQGGHA